MNYENIYFTFYFDYNYRKFDKVSLFGGLGLGYTRIEANAIRGKGFVEPNADYAHFAVRVGAEFWHHLRVTLDCKITDRRYSYYAITIGGVIGGGLKNKTKKSKKQPTYNRLIERHKAFAQKITNAANKTLVKTIKTRS